MIGDQLHAEIDRRVKAYERSVAATSRAFVEVMGAAQAIGVGSPVGDMQFNRFCLPARTGPSTDVLSLRDAIATEAQRVRDL